MDVGGQQLQLAASWNLPRGGVHRADAPHTCLAEAPPGTRNLAVRAGCGQCVDTGTHLCGHSALDQSPGILASSGRAPRTLHFQPLRLEECLDPQQAPTHHHLLTHLATHLSLIHPSFSHPSVHQPPLHSFLHEALHLAKHIPCCCSLELPAPASVPPAWTGLQRAGASIHPYSVPPPSGLSPSGSQRDPRGTQAQQQHPPAQALCWLPPSFRMKSAFHLPASSTSCLTAT